MYTNPSNIIDTVIALLERNAARINQAVQAYQPDRNMGVYKGMRATLPADAYPSLEIEPQNGANQWATTRSQRPRYSFQLTLTTLCDNEKYSVEYITTLATVLSEILTSPENLQLQVLGETKWSPSQGLCSTYILDSLVEDATYNAAKEGTIRTCEMSWFALIHEPFPEFKWQIGESDTPCILRPEIVA